LLPRRSRFAALLLGACLVSSTAGVAPAGAALPPPVKAEAFKDLVWRPIGPANMGGRVSDLAVVEKRPETFYVGLGTGGVFKTTNLGTTWSAVFEKEAVASVGAVAVWQKNPNVVWVGTGEANSRNPPRGQRVIARRWGSTLEHLGLGPRATSVGWCSTKQCQCCRGPRATVGREPSGRIRTPTAARPGACPQVDSRTGAWIW
jgi:hypothetical protein